MRARILAAGLLAGLATLATALPAAAQSVGYVTGFPGKDPAGDDEIGWGPAYRPETTFSQPGTPPTPGDFAGAAYRARTGHGPYDGIQAPMRPVRAYQYQNPGYGYAPAGYYGEPAYAPRVRAVRARYGAKHRYYTRAKAHRAYRQVMR
ncbi:hypothetical protein SAMN04487843_101459 [Methylobacterium sp. ap11]|uniref:hypothetical protein n=1 Tax=Methylobacterium sp. ap11 TaxID=1761799 RepID=UPI0008B071BE|nr:hypothetical protein [Methylobacterium sp. ap11]SEO45797.1 hypothetical protein SAMN04487843_101459 [Methylobacterium sp. ap11]